MREVLPKAAEATRALVGDLMMTTLNAAAKQFSSSHRSGGEIEAYRPPIRRSHTVDDPLDRGVGTRECGLGRQPVTKMLAKHGSVIQRVNRRQSSEFSSRTLTQRSRRRFHLPEISSC